MKCPLCGSEITSGAKYCPVCGADVEAARRRAQASAAPTQQMPRQASYAPQTSRAQAYGSPSQAAGQEQARARQQAQPQAARRGAVPMNSSMPATSSQAVRNFDTKGMSGTPKWPIVLIVLLVLVIIAAVVAFFIFRSGESTTTTDTSSTSVASSTADDSTSAGTTTDATDATTPATDATATEQPAADAAQATSGTTDAEVYQTLQAVYSAMGTLDSSISGVANDFNTSYMSSDMSVRQSCLDNARAVQTSVNDQINVVNAITLPEGSQYAGTIDTYKNLLNDLKMRIDVLVEGWQNSVNGLSESEIVEPVGRYNGENGISTYKADFDANYAGAAPAAPAA